VQLLADARQQLLALGREFGGAPAAVEQLHAQRGLQLGDALGQR
jgi:phage terminase small subunit